MPEEIICHDCNEPVPNPDPPFSSTGYGYYRLDDGGPVPVCYACAAARDREYMDQHGKILLYLTTPEVGPRDYWANFLRYPTDHSTPNPYGRVGNWAGHLSFRVTYGKITRHNMAGRAYHVWFKDHYGQMWHGVQYGDNTQIVHCRRSKGG